MKFLLLALLFAMSLPSFSSTQEARVMRALIEADIASLLNAELPTSIEARDVRCVSGVGHQKTKCRLLVNGMPGHIQGLHAKNLFDFLGGANQTTTSEGVSVRTVQGISCARLRGSSANTEVVVCQLRP